MAASSYRYSRDYPAAGGRDAYAAPSRDPYAAPAAPERSSYDYQARDDPYSARAAAAPARSAYEEPRRDASRDYERPGADRGYGKDQYSSYSGMCVVMWHVCLSVGLVWQ